MPYYPYPSTAGSEVGSLTWAVDVNRTPSQATLLEQSRWYQWYLSHMPLGSAGAGGFTSGLWTVLGSSDAVTAGLDGVDRWGSTFDGTKIVRAAAGVAHSWIVIQSPATFGDNTGPYYFCIDYSTGTDALTTFVFSKNAFTGGTTLNRPTATDQYVVTGRQLAQNPLVASRVQGWLASSGDFMVTHSPAVAPSLFPFLFMYLSVFSEADTGDIARVAALNDFITSGSGALERGQIQQLVTTDRAQTRNFDNTVTLGIAAVGPSPTITPAGSVPLLVSGNLGGAVDAATGKWNVAPVWLYSPTAANKTLKGRLPSEILWSSDGIAMASVGPTAGPPYEFIKVANFLLPWGGSVQPTAFALNEIDINTAGLCFCS